MRGNYVVATPGKYTINLTSQDGFIFGIGNGAVRVSGVNVNAPGSTVFSHYPIMGANNGPSTGAANPIVVNFPVAGSYAYEFDYQSGTGGALSLAAPVRPLYNLLVTATGSANQVLGQMASYTVQATDETGAPMANLPVTVQVTGRNQNVLNATTDATGKATVSYAAVFAGIDYLQAQATFGGLGMYSNQSPVSWAAAANSPNAPQITTNGDRQLRLPLTGTYTATVTDPQAPAGGAISVKWTQTGGPATVQIASPTQTSTVVTFPIPGIYTLQITATDTLGTSSLTVGPIEVLAQDTRSVPQGWLDGISNPQLVTGQLPVNLIPGETLTSGTLLLYPVNNTSGVIELDPNRAITLKSPTTGSGTLATIDTTLLANGPYYILLQATDTTGKTMSSGMSIVVGGDYKPGRVTTTVTDLVVPAPGLPIQISRTYDSLVRSTSSDFGYGWTLGVNVQLSVSATNDVTLTINGQRRTFYYTPYLVGYQLPDGTFAPNLLGVNFAAYTPEPGFFGTLTVGNGGSNLLGSNTGCLFDWIVKSADGVYFCYNNVGTYSPGSYVYTDPYGRVYSINRDGGLNSIKDIAGNTLTVAPTGITGSNGLKVRFVRDAQGRITKITDPLEKDYLYSYDGAGNLASVTYPGVATAAQYTYDATHLYTGGTDPRGNALPSTTYFTDGKLKSTTVKPDAQTSYVTSYAYGTTPVTITYADNSTASGLATAITNPDNTTTTVVYDSYGKIISSTDPLLHTTLTKYDASHNVASVTDPLGHTTRYTYDGNGNRTSVTYPATPASVNTTSYTTYNAAGEPVSTKDENGNVRNFTYDANYWPKLASDTIGPVVSFTFNANGTMASKAVGWDLSTTAGKSTAYSYDAYGNLTGETDALGRTTSYVYDTLGRKTSMTPPGATATTYQYDALGHVTTMTVPLGRVTTYTYDNNGNKLTETDANNHTTTYEYDALNRVKTVTYPDTKTTTYTYDFRNNAIDTVDQAQRTTHDVYDAAGRLTSVTMAFGTADAATTSYSYYDDGRKHTEVGPLGASQTTTYNYDAAGRLTSTVDAQSHNTKYGYDDAGNQVSVTDPNNHITQQQYDARRRLKKTIYNDSTTTQYEYDGPGNLASVTDQAGKKVQYTYDAANQLASVIQTNHPDPVHNTTLYGYDPLGNLATLTDANTHQTQNGFDMLSQLKTEQMPGGQTQTRTYDAAGNLKSLTDYNGHTTTYTYDAMNRLLTKVPDPSLGEPTVSFTYTATGKRESMTDASGTTTYTYDNMDRLKTKATPPGTLTYTYDTAGNVASMNSSNANGVSVAYTYDSLNRLATVVDNRLPVGQNTTTYSYDPASNLATVTYPNGLSSTFGYDTLNRMTDLNGYHYQLGATGNRQYATEPGGRRVDWTYDGIYRLTNETISLDPRGKNGAVGYTLDAVGNRLSETSSLPGIPTTSFTYDVNDRIQSTEQYDPNGNTTISGSRTFAYDFENRLKTMAVNNGPVTVTLQYDGDGNRVAKTVGGTTSRYLVDDLNPTGYAQVVEEIVGAAAQRAYTYGLQRIYQNQLIGSTWTPTFYGYDGDDGGGTVRLLTDSTGTVTDTYDYDAWGNAVNTTGSTPNAYLYRGEQYDSDLRLYYLRDRYFNPLTGRFLTRDPADGQATVPNTFHKYLYAAADPTNRIDPSGRANVLSYTSIMSWSVPATTALAVAEGAVTACLGGYVVTGLAAALTNLSAGYEVEQMQFGPCMYTYRVRPRERDKRRAPKPWFDQSKKVSDCSGTEQTEWEMKVHMDCDIPRSCLGARDKWTVIWRTALNTKCFNTRLAFMARCWRGGDAAHQRALKDVAADLTLCAETLDLIEKGKIPPLQ
jgi:RHS repeat-associated protein